MSARGEVAVPYIKHPESVAKNLLGWGEPEDFSAIGIAWGHDLLEDTETSLDEIIAASDDTIAAGIQLLTHEDETEKRCYLQNVARSPVFGQPQLQSFLIDSPHALNTVMAICKQNHTKSFTANLYRGR